MTPLLRLDSAEVLKRFFHLERALTVGCAAWVPHVRSLDAKVALARAAWEASLTAVQLRQRVYELRYPDRTLDVGPDGSLVRLYRSVTGAGSCFAAMALLAALSGALEEAYRTYLALADDLADGPSHRFLKVAIEERGRQQEDLTRAATEHAEADVVGSNVAYEQVRSQLDEWLKDPLGAAPSLDLPETRAVEVPDNPGRDARYFSTTFYWPDNFDPTFPYGDGLALRVRSAVSHVNEVWAVDTAAAALYAYAEPLGWEFTVDAARWLYDESRHMTMGARRFHDWGIPDEEVPLGDYIYTAAASEGPLYRLGMLAYFETKNINNKVKRAEAFGAMGDETSRRDMEFDWADEAIHAGYGRRWLRAALEAEGRSADEWPEVVKRCEQLITRRVEAATDEEKQRIYAQADRLLAIAKGRLS